jgi:hypothetical protein
MKRPWHIEVWQVRCKVGTCNLFCLQKFISNVAWCYYSRKHRHTLFSVHCKDDPDEDIMICCMLVYLFFINDDYCL